MLRLTVVVTALALAGPASAGWRSMRVDGSNEAAFKESVAAFQEALPRVRKHVFAQSLNDIWQAGAQSAEARDGDYTMTDYLRELDGLSYKDVVEFTDPTGKTADRYFDQAWARLTAHRLGSAPMQQGARSGGWNPARPDGEMRGRPLGGEPGLNPWQQ